MTNAEQALQAGITRMPIGTRIIRKVSQTLEVIASLIMQNKIQTLGFIIGVHA